LPTGRRRPGPRGGRRRRRATTARRSLCQRPLGKYVSNYVGKCVRWSWSARSRRCRLGSRTTLRSWRLSSRQRTTEDERWKGSCRPPRVFCPVKRSHVARGQDQWARDLTAGRKLANFSLTEPRSGSDAARPHATCCGSWSGPAPSTVVGGGERVAAGHAAGAHGRDLGCGAVQPAR
jgi:hypothetical protein